MHCGEGYHLVAVEVVAYRLAGVWLTLSIPKTFTPELVHHSRYAPFSRRTLRFVDRCLVVRRRFRTGPSWRSLLLFSAVNTAVVALIGVDLAMMALVTGEMPKQLARPNAMECRACRLVATVIPKWILVLRYAKFRQVAGRNAIGVVGAIAVNLGSCTFNKRYSDLVWA